MPSSTQQFISHLATGVAAIGAVTALAITGHLSTDTVAAVLGAATLATGGVASAAVVNALSNSAPATPPAEAPKA